MCYENLYVIDFVNKKRVFIELFVRLLVYFSVLCSFFHPILTSDNNIIIVVVNVVVKATL